MTSAHGASPAEVPRTATGLALYPRPPTEPWRGGGVAPRVVFAHGSMDRAATFAKAVRRLPELDCVRYDRRGYGRSLSAGVADTFAKHVDDLASVVDEQPSVVIGHSLGGVIALTLATQRPDVVLAVGAFEAPMGWEPWWPGNSAGNDALLAFTDQGPEEAAERFMRRMIGDERWERLPPSTRADRRAEGAALVAEVGALRDGSGAPYDAERLTVPVVSGRGSATAAHHLRGSALLAERVRGAELFEIDGAGHAAPATHPGEFAAFVRRVVVRAVGQA